MKCNSLMYTKLKEVKIRDLTLPRELGEFVNAGFFSDGDYVFLRSLMEYAPNKNKFFDKVGAECFVNSIHVDDYVSERYLDYALLFSEQILTKWSAGMPKDKLKSIISLDDFGAVVKFHIVRMGECWLNENLEKYEEAILEVDDFDDLKQWGDL